MPVEFQCLQLQKSLPRSKEKSPHRTRNGLKTQKFDHYNRDSWNNTAVVQGGFLARVWSGGLHLSLPETTRIAANVAVIQWRTGDQTRGQGHWTMPQTVTLISSFQTIRNEAQCSFQIFPNVHFAPKPLKRQKEMQRSSTLQSCNGSVMRKKLSRESLKMRPRGHTSKGGMKVAALAELRLWLLTKAAGDVPRQRLWFPVSISWYVPIFFQVTRPTAKETWSAHMFKFLDTLVATNQLVQSLDMFRQV